jgi:hypothetical protein
MYHKELYICICVFIYFFIYLNKYFFTPKPKKKKKKKKIHHSACIHNDNIYKTPIGVHLVYLVIVLKFYNNKKKSFKIL